MKRPINVLLVVLDSLRADRLSCAGYERTTSPFLDQIAREGIRFGHAFATAPWTLPAHASLFTGLFPTRHGATSETRRLATGAPTLAEVFSRAGYRTGGFCANAWVGPRTGLTRGFDSFHTQLPRGQRLARATLYTRRAADRLLRRDDGGARRTNRAALRWLADDDRPFFAFVHYDEARLPLSAPLSSGSDLLPRGASWDRMRDINRRHLRAEPLVHDDEDRAVLAAAYDATIHYLDARLEEVASVLSERGEWDRTLVVVTADHGTDLGAHELPDDRLSLFDSMLRVPLLLRCPARLPKGYVIDELAQTVDLFPTLLHLAGIEHDTSAGQGRVLVRDGIPTPGPQFVIAERSRPDPAYFARRADGFGPLTEEVRKKAVRTRQEKYVWHSDERNEYYDLARDPGETRNVAGQAAERESALRKLLFDWLAGVTATPPGSSTAPAEGSDAAVTPRPGAG